MAARLFVIVVACLYILHRSSWNAAKQVFIPACRQHVMYVTFCSIVLLIAWFIYQFWCHTHTLIFCLLIYKSLILRKPFLSVWKVTVGKAWFSKVCL